MFLDRIPEKMRQSQATFKDQTSASKSKTDLIKLKSLSSSNRESYIHKYNGRVRNSILLFYNTNLHECNLFHSVLHYIFHCLA